MVDLIEFSVKTKHIEMTKLNAPFLFLYSCEKVNAEN